MYAHMMGWDASCRGQTDHKVWAGCTQEKRVKVLLLQKVRPSGCLTDSTDTKEVDSPFSHRYLYPVSTTSLNLKKKTPPSLALVTGTPNLTFNCGAKLHLRHCPSQNASAFQARSRRANKWLMFPTATFRAGLPMILIRLPDHKEGESYTCQLSQFSRPLCEAGSWWNEKNTRGSQLCPNSERRLEMDNMRVNLFHFVLTGVQDENSYISVEEYSGALILVPSFSLQQNSSSIWTPG